jgi:DNA-binding NarL/FixJ family response regulator
MATGDGRRLLAEAFSATSDGEPGSAVGPNPGRWRLAVVEDHLLQRSHTENLLSAQPDIHLVFSGETLPDFVRWWEQEPTVTRPQLLLLDLVVDRGPSADPGTVRHLVEAGLRVLLFSAMASPPLVRQMIRVGVNGVIGKRDSIEDILNAIRTVLTGGEWLTPEMAIVIANDPRRPTLSSQEERALVLYASGLTMDAVAAAMEVQANTVKKYIQRVKQKYAALGRPLHTKVDLNRAAVVDGFVDLPVRSSATGAGPADA